MDIVGVTKAFDIVLEGNGRPFQARKVVKRQHRSLFVLCSKVNKTFRLQICNHVHVMYILKVYNCNYTWDIMEVQSGV